MYSDWLLHGTETEPANVPSGSSAGSREPDFDPVDFPDEMHCQMFDFQRPQRSAVKRRRPRVRSEELLGAPLHWIGVLHPRPLAQQLGFRPGGSAPRMLPPASFTSTKERP